DKLIDLQKETSESQKELLKKYLLKLGNINDSTYAKIKSIAQSDKIEEKVKEDFLKLTFAKASSEYQYKMLFEDKLIDLQKETSESQKELLLKFGSLKYEQIKSISRLDWLEQKVKYTFLENAFEKTDTYSQYQLLFVDCLIKADLFKKLIFLIKSTEMGLSTFKKGKYSGYSYLYVLKNDVSYYNWYENSIYYRISSPSSKIYNQLNPVWQSILEEVKLYIEGNPDLWNVKNIHYIMENISQIMKLFKIFNIDFKIDLYSKKIKEFLNSEHTNLPILDKLYLWLYGYNKHCNYIEFIQVASELTKEERKLFNSRIKELVHNNLLQQFIEQVPKAELIEETDSTKTYKCKWRNIYFKKGAIQVFFDKYSSTKDYKWEPAREEWNLLTKEYFNNRRIGDIIFKVNNNNCIIEINGLEEIDQHITIADLHKKGQSGYRVSLTREQVSRINKYFSFRNECINFLSRQNTPYNVVDVHELIIEKDGYNHRDITFIFPIPDGNGNVFLIWESAEFDKSRATHIFKCSEEELEDKLEKIKDFIENNKQTRSRLNSNDEKDLKLKEELGYLCRVIHDTDEYQTWENRMKEVLPFLK
ncbi:MAG TPA: hypothetical protein PK887_10585, partial [Ignavibacteriales bacterium]|nr:hypothetical protein [Ignavibacteriales bacterium]